MNDFSCFSICTSFISLRWEEYVFLSSPHALWKSVMLCKFVSTHFLSRTIQNLQCLWFNTYISPEHDFSHPLSMFRCCPPLYILPLYSNSKCSLCVFILIRHGCLYSVPLLVVIASLLLCLLMICGPTKHWHWPAGVTGATQVALTHQKKGESDCTTTPAADSPPWHCYPS